MRPNTFLQTSCFNYLLLVSVGSCVKRKVLSKDDDDRDQIQGCENTAEPGNFSSAYLCLGL